ncbi:MAG: hypothetical protein MUC95_09700, partial [Spirochaetes bacterium]|nr:hypothetical protein [Spirochaetota bacterium]
VSYADEKISLKIFFSETERRSVIDGKIITGIHLNDVTGKTDVKSIIPKTSYITNDYSGYEVIVTEKAFIPCGPKTNSKMGMYKILSSYSRFAGMKYYSKMDSRFKTLILKSSRIKSAGDTQELIDILYDKIPQAAVNYFLIEDNRFGEIIFKSEIYSENDNFILKNTSTHSLKKYGFTVNGPGEYQFIFFFIYDKKEAGYFYYAMQAARIRSSYLQKISFVGSESFVNRMRAMTVHYAGMMGNDWSGKLKRD